MKTYRIFISQRTNRDKYIPLQNFVVNSKNTKQEIEQFYKQRYKGFHVDTEEIQEIELVQIGEPENKNGEGLSLVEFKDHKDSTAYEWKPDHYKARILKSDIPEWNEWLKPIREAENQLQIAKDNFELKIRDKFNLKHISDFCRESEWVSFTFLPSSFKFSSKTV